jgi:tetratricopeptide (TPR) repeat protein
MNPKHFFVAILAALTGFLSVQSIAAEEQRRTPSLIAGVQEPDEMRVEPFPTNKLDLAAPERMLGEALQNSDKSKPASLLPALNRILEQYLDFSDGYIMRAFSLCESGNDRAAITADLDRALKSIAHSRTGKDSNLSLLSTQAKLEYANGDFVAAMNDLEKAVRSDLTKATEFTNSGGVKPEKTGSVCVWTEPDMDELVRRFSADYRSHLFRGLYFSKFAPLDDESLKPAIESLGKAAQLNPKSALPQFFKATLLGNLFVFHKRLNELGWSDAGRDKLNAELVGEYTKALALDPMLTSALRSRATAELNLKQFKSAILDYDKVLSIDPQDWISFHDRGLAKIELGNTYEAISDFSATIKLTKRELKQSHYYESRAEAYMKTQQWDLAIRDFTTAISLGVGGSTFLMNVGQFRAIYPEYKAASNEAIARKLNQTFFPDLTYEGFSERFLTSEAMPSTTIPDLYLKRSDAYLKKGNWGRASIDFRRAVNGFPNYADAVERWREIGPTADTRNYIDMKTFDDARKESTKVWIKQSPRSLGGDESPYTLLGFELNCRANQIRAVSSASYNAGGQIIGSGEGGRWGSVFPETIGETLYNGSCRSN